MHIAVSLTSNESFVRASHSPIVFHLFFSFFLAVSRLNDFIISSSQANVGGRRGSEVKRERERERERTRREQKRSSEKSNNPRIVSERRRPE
jgi:hypothetical protein